MRHPMITRTGLAAAGFAAFGLLAACSSSSSSTSASDLSTTEAAPTTSSSIAETTTTVAETTTTAAPTTVPATVATTVPPPACSDTAPSGSADALMTMNDDWTGDGAADTATSWLEPGSGQWYIRVQVAGGAASAVPISGVGAGYVLVTGTADVDFSLGVDPGVNRSEMIAIVGSNAAGVNLGVFGIGADGCLFQFDNGGGAPYLLPMHAAAATMSGVMCDGGAGSQFLVRLEADTADGTNWTTHDTKVERTGPHTLEDGMVIDGSITAMDPRFWNYSHAECFDTLLVDTEGDY